MKWYGVVFLLLTVGFFMIFYHLRWLEAVSRLLKRTRREMTEAARRRLLADRKQLLLLQRENSVWFFWERELRYSGWKRRVPGLTVEIWLAGNVLVLAGAFWLGLFCCKSLRTAIFGTAFLAMAEYLLVCVCKAAEARAVNENLLKLLNFLGNYSIVEGEIIGILGQVSRYVEEPVKSVLNECCYEAQITGDAGMALLVMAEKIQHPKFKELAYNMEAGIRYCADFKALVEGSRISVREYLRMTSQRKEMLREAFINMLLLLVMSIFALMAVDQLIDKSIWDILFGTFPGHAVLGITAAIFLLLFCQLLRINE